MSFDEFFRKDIEPTLITNTNYMLIVITVDYIRKEIKFTIWDLTKVFSDVFYKSLSLRYHFPYTVTAAVSRQSSSFCFILPITRPRSLWN